MSLSTEHAHLEQAAQDAVAVFARAIGICEVEYRLEQVGTETFLKFVVGRALPLYDHALRVTQKRSRQRVPFAGFWDLPSSTNGFSRVLWRPMFCRRLSPARRDVWRRGNAVARCRPRISPSRTERM